MHQTFVGVVQAEEAANYHENAERYEDFEECDWTTLESEEQRVEE